MFVLNQKGYWRQPQTKQARELMKDHNPMVELQVNFLSDTAIYLELRLNKITEDPLNRYGLADWKSK